MYDYGARNYDPAIGRWMNIDNLSEKFIAFSPYHYAGNNPVINIDLDGNKFTEAMQVWIDKLNNSVNSKTKENNESIENARNKISSGKFGLFQSEKSLTKKINNLLQHNEELANVAKEIQELDISEQVYDLVYDSSGTQGKSLVGTTTINKTRFNFENGNVEITVSFDTSLGLFAHELKHASQFERGELSFGSRIPNFSYPYLYYDKQDEMAGYQRGYLFGVSFNGELPSHYSFLPSGPNDYRSVSTINQAFKSKRTDTLQLFAQRFNQAFRIGGKTYYKK